MFSIGRLRQWNVPHAETSSLQEKVSLWLVGIVALVYELKWLVASYKQPLDPDAQNYYLMADQMQSLYDTNVREPLIIWTSKLGMWLFGADHFSLRLVGAFFFVLTAIGFYRFVRDVTGESFVALAAALLFATNSFLRELAVRGVRDTPTLSFLIMLSYFTLVRAPWLTDGRRIAGLSVSWALLSLTRLSFLAPGLLLIGYAFWKHRLRKQLFALPLAAIVLAIVPHLLNNQRVFHDPFYSLNIHAVWWRNYEFVIKKKVGCEGCPTEEEFNKSSYSGSPVSTFRYVFLMRPLSETIGRALEGYKDMLFTDGDFFRGMLGSKTSLWFWLFLVGLVSLFATKARDTLLVPLIAMNIFPFTYALDMDIRLFSPFVPFMILCVGAAGMIPLAIARKGIERLGLATNGSGGEDSLPQPALEEPIRRRSGTQR
ncbi:MAG: glycosyltransferase family 39 protein [Bdellovibrionota bacterium]